MTVKSLVKFDIKQNSSFINLSILQYVQVKNLNRSLGGNIKSREQI